MTAVLMRIEEKNQVLAFIHIRKTAGSTVDMILRQSYGARHCRVRHGKARAVAPVIAADELRRCRWVYWGMRSVAGHGIVPHSDLETSYPDIRYFTFLRDPLARCASDYQFRVRRGGLQIPFDVWIQTEIARNQQTKKIAAAEDADAAIAMLRQRVGMVGLVERFDESLVLLKKWCADPKLDIRYESKNVSSDSAIKQQLLNDPKTRAQLAEANREDDRLYRFAADELFAQNIRRYGDSFERDVLAFRATNKPLPVYPRQIFSGLLREFVYKPLAPVLRNKWNVPAGGRNVAA